MRVIYSVILETASTDSLEEMPSAKELYDNGGEEALLEITRRKPNLKNRVESAVEQAVLEFAIEQLAYGQLRVCNELKKRTIIVSASTVRNIWKRNNLETFKKRLSAL